ncbi:hypothetical protein [Bacillus sp. T33-2]|uniref:UPF0738 family protein n=1 Tax=Bacillus sp. T33-2 TaxID=2054168 RepID=UPI000C75641B|nr:hypothetical protein [Bacillus sp. T33-2]PLR97599.1 hypothetical protein CVD19_08975 [Bacillus sp. T33-2]
MTQRLNIVEATMENGELLLKADSDIALSELAATGRMLVDSDHLSFIYLAELDGEYTYIAMPEAVWPQLKQALDSNLEVFVAGGGSRFQLEGLQEEMDYLIDNIKGNSNYGEEMASKVESIF